MNTYSDVSHSSKILGTPYQYCVIIIAVLSVYYFTMFAEISLLDDRDAISGLLNLESYDLKAVFFPMAKDGGYYRPFIGLSYIIDRFWWFLDPKIMHFENVVMHLINSLLVFVVAQRFCQTKSVAGNLLPFAASLLFAMHPVNTESVNWISGRTDPMACMFVLTALLAVDVYRERGGAIWLVGAFLLTFLGSMAKETALGFIPGAALLLMAHRTAPASENTTSNLLDCTSVEKYQLVRFVCYTAAALLVAVTLLNYYMVIAIGIAYWGHVTIIRYRQIIQHKILLTMKTVFWVTGGCFLFALIFYGLRKMVFHSQTVKVSETMTLMLGDLNYTIELFMGAAGFYVKKYLIPVPLNISIREVDPLYELFGVFCYMVCIHLLTIRRPAPTLMVTGFFMLAPAFPLAFGTIAWTGYAERYNYIPSAFWTLAVVCSINEFLSDEQKRYKNVVMVALTIILCTFSVVTYQRNQIWQKNVLIFKDAVEKTPDFKPVRGLYIVSLLENKEFDEAEKQYHIAKKLFSLKYDERYDLLYASILLHRKNYSEVERVFADIDKKTKGKSIILLDEVIKYWREREEKAMDPAVKRGYTSKKLETYERLVFLNNSALTSYRLGQEYLAAGDFIRAQGAFKSAIGLFNADDPMKANAEKLLRHLDSKLIKNSQTQ